MDTPTRKPVYVYRLNMKHLEITAPGALPSILNRQAVHRTCTCIARDFTYTSYFVLMQGLDGTA